jgi:hypothetical protein
VNWLSNWDEAAKHPRRTVITMSVGGLVGGGLIGYFRFGDSVGYGVVLGLAFALVLGTMGWRTVHDPARLAELRQRRPLSSTLRVAGIRLALPFGVLALATILGLATGSVAVFEVAFAVGVVAWIVVGRFLPR